MTAPERRLAAIMFNDIVGYTALMAERPGQRSIGQIRCDGQATACRRLLELE
jgi:hypothetical protein